MLRKMTLLSVGIDKYQSLQHLGYCALDSKAIADAFEARGPITKEILNDSINNVYLSDFNNSIKSFTYQAKDSESLFFYFGGHGFSKDGRDYLATYDTQVENVETALSTDDLINNLLQSGVKNIVIIIDACRKETERSVNDVFGERTSELANRVGVVCFFGCSPKETAKELPKFNAGIFTHAFCSLLKDKNTPFTPLNYGSILIRSVKTICKDHNLSPQTPYTTVAPLEKSQYDLFSGQLHYSSASSKDMILIVGPTNAGKTTIGQHIANTHGYTHAEMSTFAWQRKEKINYLGNMQDFMEKEVWSSGNEDVIALDLLASIKDLNKVVVCGPRRMEEIETIKNSGWNIQSVFVYSDCTARFTRQGNQMGRMSLGYPEFIKKDLKEYGWGIARMSEIKNIELILNDREVTNYIQNIESIISLKDDNHYLGD